MWSADDFRTKARTYISRAESTDDPLATFLWCALGLEFLLRAPLAAVNPVLLADPNSGQGYSVLHAAGVPQPESKDPQSIASSTVLARLTAIVPSFSADDQAHARFILNLRNRELHSADMTTEDAPIASWLPRFHRLVERLSAYFGEVPSDYMSDEFLQQASRLVAEEDKRVEHKVRDRLAAAAAVFAALTEPEREARQFAPYVLGSADWTAVLCPTCENRAQIFGVAVRSGREEILDGDTITKTLHLVATSFSCRICSLQLEGVAEINAAGLPQTWQSTEFLSFEERLLMSDPEPPDYGND